jgi:hypothetical protein
MRRDGNGLGDEMIMISGESNGDNKDINDYSVSG